MGLDTSHNAWHGAYSAFMHWREEIARVAGLPPLRLMDGFFDSSEFGSLYFGQHTHVESVWKSKRQGIERLLPIKWECLKPNALHELLNHSDCEGEIPADRCVAIADELEKLIPLMPEGETGGHIWNWREATTQFVSGLRAAAASNEPLDFH